jgi:two-component system, cell cycle response regulator DivK
LEDPVPSRSGSGDPLAGVDACPTFHLTRKSSGKLEFFDDCADEMVVSDYMHIYHKVLQREPAAEPDSQVKEVVRAMAMSQMEVQTAWRQHKESRGPDNIDVCLVEDDSSIISLVRILLKAEGLNLLSVESCEDAILALRETHPRLLLVDLGMPDRSGLEIARIVRGWYNYPHIPIVALTGSAEKAGAAWRAGFSGFIPKPFVPKTFQTMVKSWVSQLAQ